MNKNRWSQAIFLLVAILLYTGCITINQLPPSTPTQTSDPIPTPIITTTPLPETTKPTPIPSPTPSPSLPPIEAFIADPNFNPGGSQLAGLGNAKITVDGLWQKNYGQTYYQTASSLTDKYKPYDLAQLQKALDELRMTPWTSLYKLNYFDCTEMSAILQRELSIRGFESWIVIGKDPTARSGHAWVVVFVRSPSMRLIPIEATALELPKPESAYRFSNGVVQTYEDYSHQGWVLQDIYQAIALRFTGEYDYWNRNDALQKLKLPTIAKISDTSPSKIFTPIPNTVSPNPTNSTKYFTLNARFNRYDIATYPRGIISIISPISPFIGLSESSAHENYIRRYETGTRVTLAAYARTGFAFTNWSGNIQWNGENGSTSSTIVINMSADVNIVANFVPSAEPTPLSIIFEGWGVDNPKVSTVNKGQTIYGRISLIGGKAEQYIIQVMKENTSGYDDSVAQTSFRYDGWRLNTTHQKFVPTLATGEEDTKGYYIRLQKDGDTIWSMPDSYPPRLIVH